MAAPSFAYVPEEGFQSFAQELTKGEWALINSQAYEGIDNKATSALIDAPLQVTWKLRLSWVLAELASARGGADGAQAADDAWDTTQKRGRALIVAATHDPEPAKRAAAARLHQSLLKGAGAAQTRLRYQQEVDYGRLQLAQAKEPQNQSDIQLLGLQSWLVEVEQTTDMLADAIGYDQGTGRAPYQRRRAALTACSSNFAAVEEHIAWVLRHGHESDLQRAGALLQSLHALANRYPPPSPTTPAPFPAPPSE